VLIYKQTEKMYCDKLNLEKTIKKPSKKRKTRGDILQPGSEPGLGEHHALNVVLKFQQIFVGYLTRPMSVLEECSVQIARGIFMSFQQHYYLNMNNKNFF
jgi:hypothetical protein